MAAATKPGPKQAVLAEAPAAGRVIELRHVVRVLGPETIKVGNTDITSYQDAENHLKEAYFSEGWDLLGYEIVNMAQGKEMGGLRYNPLTVLYVLVKRAV